MESTDGNILNNETDLDNLNKKTVNNNISGRAGIVIKCDLCDVACTGKDAYMAHIRGMKHQKTIKLHQKLGKPIPPDINLTQSNIPNSTLNTTPVITSSVSINLNKTSLPNISTSTSNKYMLSQSNIIGNDSSEKIMSTEINKHTDDNLVTKENSNIENTFNTRLDTEDGDCSNLEPIGREYIETRIDGKILSFYCKLCECQFNDPNAKDMHTKGRRHRLAYKKKVDPSLKVDIKGASTRINKSSIKQGRVQLQKTTTESQTITSISQASLNVINSNQNISNGGAIKPLMSATVEDNLSKHSQILQEYISQSK